MLAVKGGMIVLVTEYGLTVEVLVLVELYSDVVMYWVLWLFSCCFLRMLLLVLEDGGLLKSCLVFSHLTGGGGSVEAVQWCVCDLTPGYVVRTLPL